MSDDMTKIITIFNPDTKKIKYKKEKKMRVETSSWGIDNIDLEHMRQCEIVQNIQSYGNVKTTCVSLSVGHIKKKLSSYKQQDILKNKFNPDMFVSYEDTIMLIIQSKLQCHYCSCNVYILYNYVREPKQWSLDRIDNNIGHNAGNLVIACLECNLKRRRTNKDAFMFTKNMKINKMNNEN